MNLVLTYPLALLLLPLCLLPWIVNSQDVIPVPSLWLVDQDRLSNWIERLLQIIASLLILSLILAVATPHIPQQNVERTGQGAEIILLLDRSRSMDQPFVIKQNITTPIHANPSRPSKGTIARRLLSEFVASRENDRFGMVVFSTRPIRVLPLTDKQESVLAAIDAGNTGRGLAETEIATGLMESLKFFDGKDYRGSRIVVLISDGASELRVTDKAKLVDALKRLRVSFYWIYIRSYNAADLFDAAEEVTQPQQEWHRFFARSEIPYRVFTAEDPEELQAAMSDINRLQNLPILYNDIIPGEDLSRYCYWFAMLFLILLLLAELFKSRWHHV